MTTTRSPEPRPDRSPGPTVNEILRADRAPPIPAYLEESSVPMGDADIPVSRYISREWHEREKATVWKKTWQVACRVEEVAAPGDYIVYDVGDDSVLVVRTESGAIKAYVNACLHRGTALCDGQGHKKELRCPFHGMTWTLEGQLRSIPGRWDFPHVDNAKFSLPEVRAGFWGGFVFVNLDPGCVPLEDYLEVLPKQLDGRVFENRYKAAHVSQVVPCNWKVALEAFIEGYHVAETHYEKDEQGRVSPEGIAAISADTNIQYDTWPESRHINRLIMLDAVPSYSVAHRIAGGEQQIVDIMLRRVPAEVRPKLAPGERARPAIAAFNRKALSAMYRADLSSISDCDALDQIQYNIFPNFTLWTTPFAPLCYRFRPYGDSPDQALFEIWFLLPKPDEGPAPPAAKERRLAPGEPWANCAELGIYGPIVDQDMVNLPRIHKGLKAARKPGLTLAHYQESRIRHFHRTLGEYVEGAAR
ncbi:MAG TPA: aromatic ring-hydroxylating dioxygenase subunit alpha [Nevskiaceae bacterium]|nr:aromatic ring-hydroxylating dioxygenase subunit alpha [Nevskiaceae bacterium]